jgi:RNA polymerase sigma factor (sigma-70 family)
MDVSSTTATHPPRSRRGPLGSRRVGEILGAWQPTEIRIARGYPECRGLSTEQLEDLYQETVIALLARPYDSDVHLRNALHQGIRHRALNLHRDTRRRGQILAEHAPSIHRVAEASAASVSPEDMALRGEDRQVILEFLRGLDPFERQVFDLTAEGLKYRAIAKRLDVDVNEARRAARAVERKRVQFRFRHELEWQPHHRARSISLALAPLPALTAGFASLRRWLLGNGFSGKAGAVAASATLLAAGAAGVAGTGAKRNEAASPHRPTDASVDRGVARTSDGRPHHTARRAQRRYATRVVRWRATDANRPPADFGARVRTGANGTTGLHPAAAAQAEFGIERP